MVMLTCRPGHQIRKHFYELFQRDGCILSFNFFYFVVAMFRIQNVMNDSGSC